MRNSIPQGDTERGKENIGTLLQAVLLLQEAGACKCAGDGCYAIIDAEQISEIEDVREY